MNENDRVLERIELSQMMRARGAKYGTSGLRAEAEGLTDQLIYAHTLALLQHFKVRPGEKVAIAGDLRQSTPRILRATAEAVRAAGCSVTHLGYGPTPMLALYCINRGVHGIMVTASHNPASHNGHKAYSPAGEISKADEAGIVSQTVALPASRFQPDGRFTFPPADVRVTDEGTDLYTARYLDSFPPGILSGKRVGVFCHSSAGRDLMIDLYERLGAEVLPLGMSGEMVSLDTEALPVWVRDQARYWANEYRLDAVVSGDADFDRGFVFDELGDLVHTDRASVGVARFLGAQWAAAPVSCSSALEECPEFHGRTLRTPVGSTQVIAAMERLKQDHPGDVVVGYERNGGFLVGSPIDIQAALTRLGWRGGRESRRPLAQLVTRDAAIVHLSLLGLSVAAGKSLSRVIAELPPFFTESKNLEKNSPEILSGICSELERDVERRHRCWQDLEAALGGPVVKVVTIDGLQVHSSGGKWLMLRGSKNNPRDFRLIAQSGSPERALALVHALEERVAAWR